MRKMQSDKRQRVSIVEYEDGLWPAEKMANWLDISVRWLLKLTSDGVLERKERGRFDPFETTVMYVRFLRDQARNQDKEIRSAKERKEKAEADIAEIKRAQLIGELVPVEDYLSDYRDIAAKWCAGIAMIKSLTPEQIEAIFGVIKTIDLHKPEERKVIEGEEEKAEEQPKKRGRKPKPKTIELDGDGNEAI